MQNTTRECSELVLPTSAPLWDTLKKNRLHFLGSDVRFPERFFTPDAPFLPLFSSVLTTLGPTGNQARLLGGGWAVKNRKGFHGESREMAVTLDSGRDGGLGEIGALPDCGLLYILLHPRGPWL